MQSARPCALPDKTRICLAKRGEAVLRAWLVSVPEERRTVESGPGLEPGPDRNSKQWRRGLKRHLEKKPRRWCQVDAY